MKTLKGQYYQNVPKEKRSYKNAAAVMFIRTSAGVKSMRR